MLVVGKSTNLLDEEIERNVCVAEKVMRFRILPHSRSIILMLSPHLPYMTSFALQIKPY
jgi:hypothetical protein